MIEIEVTPMFRHGRQGRPQRYRLASVADRDEVRWPKRVGLRRVHGWLARSRMDADPWKVQVLPR
jgi:hypothetical protein